MIYLFLQLVKNYLSEPESLVSVSISIVYETEFLEKNRTVNCLSQAAQEISDLGNRGNGAFQCNRSDFSLDCKACYRFFECLKY